MDAAPGQPAGGGQAPRDDETAGRGQMPGMAVADRAQAPEGAGPRLPEDPAEGGAGQRHGQRKGRAEDREVEFPDLSPPGLNSPQARTVPSGAVACRSRRPGALTRRSQSSSRGSAQAYMAQPVSPSRHMRAKRAFRPASSRTASRRKASCTPAWPQCRVFVCSIRAPAVCGVTEGDERGPPPAAATPSRNESGAAVSRGSPLSRRVSRYGRCRGRSRRQLPPAMPLPRGGDRAPFIVPSPARHS